MSVVANSFTKNTHAERALCAQAPKASMVCCVPRGRSLLVGALFLWELSPHAQAGHAAKTAASPIANKRELRSQTASKPQCVPKPHAASRATRADQSVRQA